MKLPDLVLAGFVVTFVALFIGLAERERRLRAARLETFTWVVVQRGWRFNSRYARGKSTASIGGKASTCPADGPPRSSSFRVGRSPPPPILRWWNAAPGAPPPSGPVVALLNTDGKAMPDVSTIEGRLARFAARRRFARAFKCHFGEALSLDGRDLQRVDGLGSPSDRFVAFSD